MQQKQIKTRVDIQSQSNLVYIVYQHVFKQNPFLLARAVLSIFLNDINRMNRTLYDNVYHALATNQFQQNQQMRRKSVSSR